MKTAWVDRQLAVVLVFSMVLCLKESASVILHKVSVPKNILNGSLPYVILDCVYSLNKSELDGMVLKWYLNGKTIYQWIPPAHPQGLGELRGKINLDFEISPAPFTRHRALYLYYPTTEMTGDYMCKVSTLQNEVSDTKKMVVYEPPHQITLMHSKSFGDHVNVTCLVDHAFPEPSLALYHGQANNRIRLTDVEVRADRYPNGAWQKRVFVLLSDSSLNLENVFECEVLLPHTDIAIRKTTLYSPGHPMVMASASGASATCLKLLHKVTFWTLLVDLAARRLTARRP